MRDLELIGKEYDALVRDSEKLQMIKRLITGTTLTSETKVEVIAEMCGWAEDMPCKEAAGDAGINTPPEQMKTAGEPEEEQPDPEAEKPQKPQKPQKPKKRNTIDRGKVMALKNAGWSVKEIADEVRCSEQAVYNILKRLEDATNENSENEA